MESQGWQKVVAFPWVCVLDGLQACYTWDSAPITRWTRWKHQTCVKNQVRPLWHLSAALPCMDPWVLLTTDSTYNRATHSLNTWDSQQRAEVWMRSPHLMIAWGPWRLPIQWGPELFAANEWEIVASIRGDLCDPCSGLFLVLWKKKTSLRKATLRRKVY